jgi:hypothetical protein
MDLQKVDCMVQTFPLAKANEAFSKLVLGFLRQIQGLTTLRY